MYTTIITPMSGGDFSARSISVGHHLARLMNAPMKIVSFALTAQHADDLRSIVQAQAEAITDVEVTWQVRKVTHVVAEIAKELSDDPGALICMGSVGRSHSAPVLGSVAEGVLKETFGPLLLVGPHSVVDGFSPHGAMVVCTDGSATANEILPIAAQWAITLPLEPWVVNVQDPDSPAPTGELQSDIGTDAIGAWRVAHALQGQIGRTVQHEVLHKSGPARGIAAFAHERKATMIAMSTHGATGLRRVALGSVAMAVVHRATCPVLVHRAPHVRTPS